MDSVEEGALYADQVVRESEAFTDAVNALGDAHNFDADQRQQLADYAKEVSRRSGASAFDVVDRIGTALNTYPGVRLDLARQLDEATYPRPT